MGDPPDQRWILAEPFRRGVVLYPVLFPQTAGIAESADPALGADACAGEHEDAGPLADGDRGEGCARGHSREGDHTRSRIPMSTSMSTVDVDGRGSGSGRISTLRPAHS